MARASSSLDSIARAMMEHELRRGTCFALCTSIVGFSTMAAFATSVATASIWQWLPSTTTAILAWALLDSRRRRLRELGQGDGGVRSSTADRDPAGGGSDGRLVSQVIRIQMICALGAMLIWSPLVALAVEDAFAGTTGWWIAAMHAVGFAAFVAMIWLNVLDQDRALRRFAASTTGATRDGRAAEPTGSSAARAADA